MGGGSETYRSAQVQGLTKEFGTVKKKLILESGKYLSDGMDSVIKAKGQHIVDIKSMYNKPYLKTMGYDISDGVLVEKLSEGAILEYTQNNIDSTATYVSNPKINTLSAFEQTILELQDKPNFKRSEVSFTHTDSKKYYYFTSVQNGTYIDISCYMNDEDTVTPYLENKYPDGYAILDMNTYPLVDDGSVYWKAEVEYIYYEDEEVDGEIVTFQKLGLTTEYIDCIFIYFTVLDEEEAQMYTIAQQHSGPFTITGVYIHEESDGDGGTSTRTYTVTVTGTFTVTYIGNGEYSYIMDAPYPNDQDKYRNRAWDNGVYSYQDQKVSQVTQATINNVRKLIWDYGTDRGDMDNVRKTYMSSSVLKDFMVQEKSDAYPIIPLKRNFNFVNGKKMDLVLKKLGIEGEDFHQSLQQEEICDAYLFFGIPFSADNPNPGLIQYIFEFFTTLSNVRENYDKHAQDKGANTLNISFDGMGLHQNFNVESEVIVEPATRPVGTYWIQTKSETVVKEYNESGQPIYETRNYYEYYHQESEDYYIRIRPKATQFWYRLGGRNWGGVGEDEDENVELRLPILRKITNKMHFNLLCDVIEQSISIAVYAEKTVKVKWYQTMFFKFILYAVMIVTQQYWMLAITFATEVIVDKWGAKWGSAFYIIATTALIITQNYGKAFEMSAQNIMYTASQVLSITSQINNLIFQIEFEKKQDDYKSKLDTQEEELKKLREEYKELYHNEGMIVNMFNNFKTLDDIDRYYDIATGNFDSYYLMFDFATDYDKFYVTT